MSLIWKRKGNTWLDIGSICFGDFDLKKSFYSSIDSSVIFFWRKLPSLIKLLGKFIRQIRLILVLLSDGVRSKTCILLNFDHNAYVYVHMSVMSLWCLIQGSNKFGFAWRKRNGWIGLPFKILILCFILYCLGWTLDQALIFFSSSTYPTFDRGS